MLVSDAQPRKLRFPPPVWRRAMRIARTLGETEAGPRYQIAAIIQHCGPRFANQILQDTRAALAQGGMLVPDGSRRRTPGGVFFILARNQMTEEQKQAVFVRPRDRRFHWTSRHETVVPLLAEPGEVYAVTVTLIGRPAEVWEYDDVIILRMSYEGVKTPTPRGVPQMQLLDNLYTVFISPDHWREVNLEDDQQMLVVEGLCAYEPQVEGLAVYAMQVATQRPKKKRKRA
jgi:hypothetical protein